MHYITEIILIAEGRALHYWDHTDGGR